MAEFEQGEILKDHRVTKTKDENGTLIVFRPDDSVFKKYNYRMDYVENQLWNYAYLNAGLKIILNGKTLVSKNGLLDLLERKTNVETLRYPIVHLKM